MLDTLEKKGFVKRKLSIKNNRPVKSVEITEAGKEKVTDVLDRIRPHYEFVKERINNSDVAKVGDLLKELRKILDETLEIQI